MTYGELTVQLPDGEELVMVDDAEWLGATPGPDPREASLSLRRQVSDGPVVEPTP